MRYYITTPIYYVNDKPHIGHAYTTLAADILTRFFRMQGKEVFFLTGTDEHGMKIAEIAKKAGKTPKEICDENSENFKRAWENLEIKYDYFIRTTDKRHEEAVKKFVKKLKEKNVIYEKEYKGLYCIGCEKFLTEKDLVDGLCPDHKRKPEEVSENNFFFRLDLKAVKELIKTKKLKILPDRAESEALGLLNQELDDFSISRQKERVKWGIDLPFDKNQIIYVWVDALLNYISAIGYGDNEEEFKKWWVDARVIHLLAKDILKFHAVYWPAMLLSIGIKNPDEEFIHGFFTINGQKMSKTLGNFIDPNDLVQKFGAEVTRYLLLSQFPLSQDGDVKEEKFAEKYNSDLAQGIGNLVSRVLALGEQYGKQIMIKCSSHDLINKSWNDYEKQMGEFCFNDALVTIWNLISYCDKYISDTKPWQKINDDEEFQEILGLLIYILGNVALMLSPIMPKTSITILEYFNLHDVSKEDWLSILVLLKKQLPLFPRLDN
jgi:methionyl-tRNA synthetase